MEYFLWLIIFFWIPIAVLSALNYRYFSQYHATLIGATIFVYITHLPIEYFVLKDVLIMHSGNWSGIWIAGFVFEDFFYFGTYAVLLTMIVLLVRRFVHEGASDGK